MSWLSTIEPVIRRQERSKGGAERKTRWLRDPKNRERYNRQRRLAARKSR